MIPSLSNQWAIIPDDDTAGATNHVVPLDDTRIHEMGETCWCEPAIEIDADSRINGLVVTHNAHDGREKYENGQRKPH